MNKFGLPSLKYLEFGNLFSGSFKKFNYKIFPNIDDGKVRVVVFLGDFCCENSKILFEEFFNFSKDMIFNINLWLTKKFEEIF